MSVLEWKKLDLFHLVTPPYSNLQSLSGEITAHCFNRNTTVFCDQNGYIHVYMDNWDGVVFKSQLGDKQLIKLCALTFNDLLATATQDKNFVVYINLYDLRRLTKRQGAPIIATANLPATSTVTCMQAETVTDKLFALSIGFDKGDFLLHCGRITRDLTANFRQHSIGLRPINGIQFKTFSRSLDALQQVCNIFVISLNGVFCFVVNDKGQAEPKITLDDDEKKFNRCCTMRQARSLELNYPDSEAFLVVGGDDAMYCFTRDGRGPCYAIEGHKRYLSWIGHYIIAVIQNQRSVLSLKPGAAIIVVDTENKMIVFYKQIEDLFCIVSRKDCFYVVTRMETSNKNYIYNVQLLEEYDLSFKVRLLIKNAMYDTTIRLLEREGYANSEDAALVGYQFGNHLLAKGDPSRAVKEYIRTVNFVKPFNIISKLLSPRYNEYLIEYLEQLVKSDAATDEHRRLLQSCLDRKDLNCGIEQLSTVEDGTHNTDNIQLCDFKYPSNRAANFLLFTNVWQNIRKDQNLAELYKEQEILNFFLESGDDLLAKHSETVLRTIKALVQDKQIDNILNFLCILSPNIEFCLNILSDIIQLNPNCDENLYYYSLILHLELWHKNQTTSEDILNFLQNKRLRQDKVLIICGLYLFSNGIKYIQNNPTEAELCTGGETILKECLNSLMKNYPDHSVLFETSSRSFLMLLKSACSNMDMKTLHLKQFFKDKALFTFLDTHNELQSINDLKDEIKQLTTLISRYKHNPIEFRNTSCDICRQPLHMPSIYFLCQHSFHKECLNYNSKDVSNASCSVCCGNVNFNIGKQDMNPFPEEESGDIIAGISKSLATGIIEIISGNNINAQPWVEGFQENKIAASTNPFDSNYNSFD